MKRARAGGRVREAAGGRSVDAARRRVGALVVLVPALAAATAGCGGDAARQGLLPPATVAVRFAEIQAAVFTPRCAVPGCHGGPAPLQGLDLTAGRAHAALVGVPSTELPAFLLVEPGNAANSYLLLKLAGDPRMIGDRMPLGGPFLGTEDLDRIALWIEDGARDD